MNKNKLFITKILKLSVFLLCVFVFFIWFFESKLACKECINSKRKITLKDKEYGNKIDRVCSDDFETMRDYKNYIQDLEKEGFRCKRDFLN